MVNSASWMARNSVAANLLMLLLLVGGYMAMNSTKKEVFPQIKTNTISVSVDYPGASPAEIETSILTSIEDEVQGIEGIKEVTSRAIEGNGKVTAELFDFVNQSQVLQDISTAVDNIRSFPEGAEPANVSIDSYKRLSVSVIVYGEQAPLVLYDYAQYIKQQLTALSEVSLVEIANRQQFEIEIAVDPIMLEHYDLSLQQIATTIDSYTKEIPAGSMTTSNGDLLIRTGNRPEHSINYHTIPVVINPNGGIITLADIATIKEKFANDKLVEYFNDLPAIRLIAYSTEAESPIEVAKSINKYIDSLPNQDAISLKVFEDRSKIFADRINLLVRNALMGLILVMIILTVFLDHRLAFWVMLGIPVSIVGAFLLFNFTGATINMVSLFAFIVTLGIVVDDAIIVGEAIFNKRQQGLSGIESAIYGIKEMAMPVTFSIITNMVAFTPLLLVPGAMGDIFRQIPAVVISVLTVSLIESIYILPAHLATVSTRTKENFLVKNRRKINLVIQDFTDNKLKSWIQLSLSHRYITLSACVGILLISIGLLNSNLINFSFLPQIDRDLITANATLPIGVPLDTAETIRNQLVSSAKQTAREHGGEQIIKGIYSIIGANNSGSHKVEIKVNLVSSTERDIGGINFAKYWRQISNDISGIDNLYFRGRTGQNRDYPIQIELSHPNLELLPNIAKELSHELASIRGVIEINDGVDLGKQQLSIQTKPSANSLAITTQQIANQLRHGFYGVEATRFQRNANEVKVMVRLDKQHSGHLNFIDTMKIKSNAGSYVPLNYLADISFGRAFTEINRTNGARVISVTAAQDPENGNLQNNINLLKSEILPEISAKYPGVKYSFSGEENTRSESLGFLKLAFIAVLLCIYALLAIPFKSYLQPLAVMVAIPFGITGSIVGHLLLGYNISIISIIGIVGLTGIVINDSLILLVTLNRIQQEQNLNTIDAAIKAALRRFKPIMLTTITTFTGLMPLLFETSVQARFLIPMAISISFGILFSTVIILLLIPAIFLIIQDCKHKLLRL